MTVHVAKHGYFHINPFPILKFIGSVVIFIIALLMAFATVSVLFTL
jgi:hypothetical protein